MANIQSAIKRARQNEKRHDRNRMILSRMRTFVKRANTLILEGDKDEAAEAVRVAFSQIDKAAQKGVLHRNQAARRKARLAKRYNAMA